MMSLPAPPQKYDSSVEAERNRVLELADWHSLKRDVDIELVNAAIYLRSPNGSRWKVTVSNAGVLSATAA